jgi:hypothetical protein
MKIESYTQEIKLEVEVVGISPMAMLKIYYYLRLVNATV